MWWTLSVHFCLKLIYSTRFCTCHRGQRVLWKFASVGYCIQTWDKLPLRRASHTSTTQSLSLSVSHSSSLAVSRPSLCIHQLSITFNSKEERTWLPLWEADKFRKKEKTLWEFSVIQKLTSESLVVSSPRGHFVPGLVVVWWLWTTVSCLQR